MSDLRELEQRITSNKSDALAEHITGMVNQWEQRRDVEYRAKWSEYARMWKGEWAPQDRERASERSRAIMPAIAQAVDSAVSEVEEAMFGRERWLDLDTDDKNTPQDEGQLGRVIADNLLADMRHMKAGVSECALLAAVYGTGIGKLVVKDAGPDAIRQELLAIQPHEFVIDPAAETIEEAHGVAHVFHLPRNVVLERQRQGIYDAIDPGSAPDADGNHQDSPQYLDTDTVRIVEYQGLVPSRMLPETSDTGKKLQFEEDRPVEAIVTIANDNVLLRAVENPLPMRDRGFVAFQWSTCPGKFWGRGVVEMGYWPQKVLDSEIRSRIDALAMSVHPMMGINAAMVPRGADFSVRPGRNVFFNGNPAEAAIPFRFPPPDPQTYTQSQEMARYIEMGTGQLQAATPFGSNGRNETASGMSMMLGASIRRTRRTMANIERQYMRPLVAKVLERFQEFEPARYPPIQFPFKIHGTLGMMAREFEQVQLTQLMQAMPPGPTQLMLLRAVVDNMSLVNRQGMVALVDQLLQQSLQPQEPPPDLGGMARMISAKTREQEVQIQSQLDAARLRLEEQKLQLGQSNNTLAHQRDLMRISVDADRQDSEEMQKTSQSILNLAKAEAEELGAQLNQYRESLNSLPAPTAENAPTQGLDVDDIRAELAALKAQLEAHPAPGLNGEDIQPIRIDRDAEGLVTGVNGRQVQRNAQGLIETLQ